MKNLVRIDKHHIPLEHVVLIEKFVPNPELPLSSPREFKARIVMLNRDSILTEESVQELAEAHGLRILPEDDAAINVGIFYRVESFTPTPEFRPSKPFVTRLVWRDKEGNSQSKLLITKPEDVLSVLVNDGVADDKNVSPASRPQRARSRRRAARAERSAPQL